MCARTPSPASPGDRMMGLARIDPSTGHARPEIARLAVATALAIVGSLLADVLLVAVGTHLFPATKGYEHFRLADYATLIVIGVVAACVAWPIVARISATPRWLFFRLACLVTLVLWLPDLVLVVRHQPVRAVVVLMIMHLAVALATYQCLVRVAPATQLPVAGAPIGRSDPERSQRRLAAALGAVVSVEFVLGIATLVWVPTDRPSGTVPAEGTVIYVVHALLGIPLVVGAVWLVAQAGESSRMIRLAAWIGAVGVGLAGIGGVLTAAHPLRLVGIVLMILGPAVAGFGYLIPALDRLSDEDVPSTDD
jgi:hypothetical protein